MSGAYRDDRYQIERAAPWHVRFLPDIESQAARLFDGHEVPDQVIADSTDAEAFLRSQQDGLLWVALSPSSRGEPVGFALVELTDAGAHLEEMDVHPSHGRRGVGSALVRAVCAWAKTRGLREVTLTTYRDIPWNAPLYARLGFERDVSESRAALPASATTLTASFEERRGLLKVEVKTVGGDLAERIEAEAESRPAAPVMVDLPLFEPAVGAATEALVEAGFFYGARLPEYVLDSDVLRLQRIFGDPIEPRLETSGGRDLLAYTIRDQSRPGTPIQV